MKSFCIKLQNNKISNEIFEKCTSKHLDNLKINMRNFPIYKNIVFHYTGAQIDLFYKYLSDLIATSIIDFYEKHLIYRIIHENYFYFFDLEIEEIFNICLENNNELTSEEKYELIYHKCLNYVSENKSMVLDGFINFRLFDYILILEEVVDYSINKYLVQREYLEFIKLLKEYILLSPCKSNKVHLIYSEFNSLLVDDCGKIIPLEENISNVKYLSDISFSKNDYCLNTLLTILPSEIVLHLAYREDEFIDTLKSVFGNRIKICNSCEICKLHQKKADFN